MAFVHNEGSFTLFRNKKKNDRQPDYTGKGTLTAKPVRLAVWERDGRLSGKIEFLEEQASEEVPF